MKDFPLQFCCVALLGEGFRGTPCGAQGSLLAVLGAPYAVLVMIEPKSAVHKEHSCYFVISMYSCAS